LWAGIGGRAKDGASDSEEARVRSKHRDGSAEHEARALVGGGGGAGACRMECSPFKLS